MTRPADRCLSGRAGVAFPIVIADLNRFSTLELDEMEISGDEIFDLAFGRMVAGPETLIGM